MSKKTTLAQSESLEIAATPKACYDAICDFATYPDWQRAVTKVEIEETFPNGRQKVAAFTIKVLLGKAFYVLSYTYNDRKKAFKWDYVRGDPKDVTGGFTFVPGPGHSRKTPCTIATYTLAFDTGLPIPQALATRLTRESIKACLRDLRRHVEKPQH